MSVSCFSFSRLYSGKPQHCIRASAVSSHFPVQMIARDPPGMADITDDFPSLHLLTGGDADGRTMGVQRLQPAAVVDLDVIAVAAALAVKTVGNGDDAVCSGKDRRTLGAGNVGAGVGTDLAGDGIHAVTELRGDRTRNRQWPLQGACRGAGTVRVHKFSTALCKTAEQFCP